MTKQEITVQSVVSPDKVGLDKETVLQPENTLVIHNVKANHWARIYD